MPRFKVVITLISIAAVIIIAMAIYVILNFSSIDLTRSIVLIAIGLLVLFTVMVILLMLLRGINPKN
jgi:hypothetical protein